MPKKLYSTVPTGYPVCIHSQCPKASECLHQIAYELLRKDKTYMHLINPDLCTADDNCTYFRSNKPVRYACGFTKFQQRMFPDQYDRFCKILISHYRRTPFYERRRGETALSPAEQELILQTLKEVGVTEPMEFDHYEEAINWND